MITAVPMTSREKFGLFGCLTLLVVLAFSSSMHFILEYPDRPIFQILPIIGVLVLVSLAIMIFVSPSSGLMTMVVSGSLALVVFRVIAPDQFTKIVAPIGEGVSQFFEGKS